MVRLAWAALAAAALAGGCAPSAKPAAGPTGAAAKSPATPGAPKATPKETRTDQRTAQQRTAQRPGPGGPTAPLAATDPCALRLHDICGPLLLYYLTNHRLPERLEELAPFADDDADFQTTCPVSGKPYVYVPAGIASGSGRVLLVYDAVPAHAGVRWVIAASPPEGDRPLTTWVMPFDEEHFRRLVPKPGG